MSFSSLLAVHDVIIPSANKYIRQLSNHSLIQSHLLQPCQLILIFFASFVSLAETVSSSCRTILK
ncbi:MAG: hypothetical protein WCP19_13025 [Chloroflexota bacterium]